MFLMVACRRITRGVIFSEIPCKVFNMGLRVWRIRITLRKGVSYVSMFTIHLLTDR